MSSNLCLPFGRPSAYFFLKCNRSTCWYSLWQHESTILAQLELYHFYHRVNIQRAIDVWVELGPRLFVFYFVFDFGSVYAEEQKIILSSVHSIRHAYHLARSGAVDKAIRVKSVPSIFCF